MESFSFEMETCPVASSFDSMMKKYGKEHWMAEKITSEQDEAFANW